MYFFESRVRYSEVDCYGRLSFSSLLDYFQDCSSFQSEDLQIGIDYLRGQNLAWVLVSWNIVVKKYPILGQKIAIYTWPYAFQGCMGYRNYAMKDENGDILAYAASLWVLMDVKKQRPVRIPKEVVQVYAIEPELEMKKLSRKIILPEGMKAEKPFCVQKFHLDTNIHVNNGKYVAMAQEYLPEEFEIGTLHAEYKKSALFGDTIYPFVDMHPDLVTVLLADAEGNPYVIIEMERKYD